ncbi:MAG: radical SAM protein, partial [Patescibacteria group bacterium]|nr:radical SAM protein [Patescibacteria group bacterium]
MKITFVAMGAENISLEALSAVLKKHGHQTSLAFDRSLFDDAAYFPIPFLAKLFNNRGEALDKVISSKPDLVAFSVFADNYQWALQMASDIKKKIKVPIIFGGIHPTSVPQEVIKQKEVDIICLGEGDYPLLELVESMEKKKIDYKIKNLWFKKGNKIIKNPLRPSIKNLDELPLPDKELFEKYVPISNYYLTVTSKGCLYACSYCSQNFLQNWERKNKLGKFLRERSVESVLEELALAKEKYQIKRIDIKNNILSGSMDWSYDFLKKYKKQITLPFRIMGHPNLMTKKYCTELKKAGCWHVQLGIESLNPEVRKKVLLRFETNQAIISALDEMDKAGLGYSTDFIIGLPGENDEDLIFALRTLAGRPGLIRASIFWLEYLPGVQITKDALKRKALTKEAVMRINEGRQQNYLSTGSIVEEEKTRKLK